MISRKSIRSRRGFTLTELAIVLGVVGLVLSSIWVAAAGVYENYRVSHAQTEVLTMVQGLKTLYANGITDDNGGDITAAAIAAGVMPADMVQPGNYSYGLGPWPGVQVNVYSASKYNGFTISFWNLTQSACNHLADAIATGQVLVNNGMIWEGIGNTIRKMAPYGNDIPFTATDVQQQCQVSNGNSVQVTYSVN